ncbi:hypothetical protein [Streptomyces alboflavus]|uniref:hypothetical protein n=1 Tax=Streptomyces alboflavus TaxID=67267 RepID=UPI003AAAA5CD
MPISTNRPPRGSSRSDASTNSRAREFNTTSTPRPSVSASTDVSKSRVREEAMRESSRPRPAARPTCRCWPSRARRRRSAGELHCGHADTTGGGVHQDRLSGFERARSRRA